MDGTCLERKTINEMMAFDDARPQNLGATARLTALLFRAA